MGRVAGARLLALVHVGGGGVLHVDGDAVPLAPIGVIPRLLNRPGVSKLNWYTALLTMH